MNRSRLTLAVVCAATAMLMLDIAVVNTAVPSIARDLHAGFQSIQWIVDAYTVALAATVLTAGSIADRLGRRRTFAFGLVLFTALLRGNSSGWSSTEIVSLLAVAGVALVAFVFVELHSRAPMLPPALFRNPSFTGAQVAAFAISASFFAQFIYASLYLQNVLGLSPIGTGLAFMPATAVLFVVSGFTAQFQAKVSARLLVSVGLVGVTIGLV